MLGGIALRDHPHITSPPRGEGGPPKGDTSIHYVVKRVTRGGQKIPKWRWRNTMWMVPNRNRTARTTYVTRYVLVLYQNHVLCKDPHFIFDIFYKLYWYKYINFLFELFISQGWWRAHHFISTVTGGVLLVWPDGECYQSFR